MNSTFHDVRPLTSPVYASLGDVGRSLHWDDVQMTYDAKMLIPQKFRNTNVAVAQNRMILWIAPVSRTLGSNFFGNVTFISDWPSILEKFGPNLYLVDQSIHNNKGHTRVLLTSSTYGSLEKVDLQAEGSAIIERDCRLLHAKKCNCKNGEEGLHQLQIAIETDDEGGAWLYERCRVVVDDHSDVNHEVLKRNNFQRKKGFKSYQSYKCFKFNTAQRKPCPFMLSATQTKILLGSQCPDLLNRIDIIESDTADNMPNLNAVAESDTAENMPNINDVAESDTAENMSNMIDVAESDTAENNPNLIIVAESDTSVKKPNLIDVGKFDTTEKKPSKRTQTLDSNNYDDDDDFESIRRAEEYDYGNDGTYQFDYFEFEDQDIWNNDDDDYDQEQFEPEPDYDDAQEVEPEPVDDYDHEQFEPEPDYDDAQEVQEDQEQIELEPDLYGHQNVGAEEDPHEHENDYVTEPETPFGLYEGEPELETVVYEYDQPEEDQFNEDRDLDNYYQQMEDQLYADREESELETVVHEYDQPVEDQFNEDRDLDNYYQQKEDQFYADRDFDDYY